jgi:hypothetical protein
LTRPVYCRPPREIFSVITSCRNRRRIPSALEEGSAMATVSVLRVAARRVVRNACERQRLGSALSNAGDDWKSRTVMTNSGVRRSSQPRALVPAAGLGRNAATPLTGRTSKPTTAWPRGSGGGFDGQFDTSSTAITMTPAATSSLSTHASAHSVGDAAARTRLRTTEFTKDRPKLYG